MAKENNYWTFPPRVSDDAQRLFNDLVRQPWQCNRELRGWYPSVDFYENDDAFILEADLPGVRPQDVQVEIVDAELILRGRRVVQHSSADAAFLTWSDRPENSSGGWNCLNQSVKKPSKWNSATACCT